jgi:hypothetical protein
MKAGSRTQAEILHWTLPRVLGAGYGIFSRKAANSRWPEFFITAFVLKKYRKKSSFAFMLRHGYAGMKKHQLPGGEVKTLLARLIGAKPQQLFQLAGIYSGLNRERGPAVATAALFEIIKIVNEKRKKAPRHRKVSVAKKRG